MRPEFYLERAYECVENAKRAQNQNDRERWIHDAVTWHTLARIAAEISADGEILRRDQRSSVPSD